MNQPAHSVFVSYARDDSDWVTIAVNLLIAGGAKVFMDVRDIAYGDKWEEVLLAKLREVERVMVFWSRNAADSEWVTKEWRLALNNGKRLVPVPIDDTPLPDDLSQFQALTSLKPLLSKAMAQGPSPAPPKAARANAGRLLVLAATAVVLAVVVPRLLFEQAVDEVPAPGVETPATTAPPLPRPETQQPSAGVEPPTPVAPTEPPVTPVQPTPAPQPVEPPAVPAEQHEYSSLLPLVWPLAGVVALAAILLLIVSRLRRWLKQAKSRDILRQRMQPPAGALDAQLATRVVNLVFEQPDQPS